MLLKFKYSILQISPFFFILSLSAQNVNCAADKGKLIGIINNQIVEIDTTTAQTTVLFNTDIPPNTNIDHLTFSEMDQQFYTVFDNNLLNNQQLVAIDLNGNHTFIGNINLPGEDIYLNEGLTYNENDALLYASVSIDGGPSVNDFASETIIAINPQNANATLVSQIVNGGTIQSDIDDLIIVNNTLFIGDGAPPGTNLTEFYTENFNLIDSTFNPNQIFSTAFIQFFDFGNIGNNIYFSNLNRVLYKFDINTNNLTNLGTTHNPSQFNGQQITGITFARITGCTDPLDLNYNPLATCDDGSCSCAALVCTNSIVSLGNSGIASLTATELILNSACFSNASVFPNTFNCGNIGIQNVTVSANDSIGTIQTCQSAITVVDDVSPICNVQDIAVSLNNYGNAVITSEEINLNSSDNCSIYLGSVFPCSFSCSDANNVVQVTLTIYDFFNNTSSCQANVTVLDPLGLCSGNLCGDGIQNADELGIDCGGSFCLPCSE